MSTKEALPYRCVDCCAPAASLYKEYTKTSIKLTSCVDCSRNVDPYVERDWALVVLDCVLLRLPAYRHVLWNTDFEMSARKVCQYTLGASLLQAYLNWEALGTEGYESTDNRFLRLLVYSMSSILMQGAATYLVIKYLSSKQTKEPSLYQVSLGLVLPLSFAVGTLLVLVWENTLTVRMLGKLLEALFQFTAITVIGGGADSFLLGLLVRTCTCMIVARLFHLPCLGLVLQEQFCIST